jgi:hypothetical protein
MRCLKNILLASALLTAPLSNAEDTIKESSKKIAKATLYNFIKKEAEVPTFQIKGTEKNKSEKVLEENQGKITYQTRAENNTVYLKIKPEKKEEELTFEDYFQINESSKLAIIYSSDSNILEVKQQGNFAKQNFFRKNKITLEKKGLLSLENQEEANIILNNASNILEELIAKTPEPIKKKYEKFLENSLQKEKEKFLERIEQKEDNFKFDLIPTNFPDKLMGQKLTELEYKIVFDKIPNKVFLYSKTDLDNNLRDIFQVIELGKKDLIRKIRLEHNRTDFNYSTWLIDLETEKTERVYNENKEVNKKYDLSIELIGFEGKINSKLAKDIYGLEMKDIEGVKEINPLLKRKQENLEEDFNGIYLIKTQENNYFLLGIEKFRAFFSQKKSKDSERVKIDSWYDPKTIFLEINYKQIDYP